MVKAQAIVGGNMQGVFQTVAANPTAVGRVSIGTAQTATADGVPIRLLPYNKVAATAVNLENGSCPMLGQLNLVAKESVAPQTSSVVRLPRSHTTMSMDGPGDGSIRKGAR